MAGLSIILQLSGTVGISPTLLPSNGLMFLGNMIVRVDGLVFGEKMRVGKREHRLGNTAPEKALSIR